MFKCIYKWWVALGDGLLFPILENLRLLYVFSALYDLMFRVACCPSEARRQGGDLMTAVMLLTTVVIL